MTQEIKPSYSIETGIPVPKPRRREGGITETLLGMNVGESFLIPSAKRAFVYTTAKRIGIKIATRKNNATTARVWKIA